jgi:uncharacterized protein YjeT (DUF2065 family)
MLKYFLIGVGFVFLIEGLIYFFLANKLKSFYEVLITFKYENIRFFSGFFIIFGLSIIYLTLKFYQTQ